MGPSMLVGGSSWTNQGRRWATATNIGQNQYLRWHSLCFRFSKWSFWMILMSYYICVFWTSSLFRDDTHTHFETWLTRLAESSPLFLHGHLGVNGWCLQGFPTLNISLDEHGKNIVTLEPFKIPSFKGFQHIWPRDLLSNFSLASGNQDGLEREDPICQPKGRWRRWQTPVGRQSALGEDQRGTTIDGNGLKEERKYPNHGPLAARKIWS